MDRQVLYINACVRKESRTEKLAERLLLKVAKAYEEIRLEDLDFPLVNEEYLDMRDRLISQGDYQNKAFDLARQFAEAKTIVIAAPYWDLSFPATLKQYLELINVVGITFRYSDQGIPIGLCKADRLYYVTTAGGPFAPDNYGFGYVKALAQNYYGIEDVRQIKAVGLDVYGADVEAIMRSAEESLPDCCSD